MTNEEAKEIMSKVTFYWELGEQILTQNQINEALDMAIKALEQQPNRCDSCIHSEEQDGSNCYECVKGIADNFEAQQTNADCISRQAALDLINANWKYEDLEMDVASLPSVTPQPKIGRWVGVNPMVDTLICSECGENIISEEFKSKYCPNCGVKMEEVEE